VPLVNDWHRVNDSQSQGKSCNSFLCPVLESQLSTGQNAPKISIDENPVFQALAFTFHRSFNFAQDGKMRDTLIYEMTPRRQISRLLFLIMGIGFTVQGLYGMYFFSIRGPGHGADWLGILTSLSFLGFPMGILCVSIFYLWTVRSTVVHSWGYLEFAVCILIHALQFVLAITILGGPLRFGGALLALSFGISNFIFASRTALSASNP
jgi:hypothetical protein